jgi:SHS2 domain-containing protein
LTAAWGIGYYTQVNMKRFDFVDHTADIGVRAVGDTLEEAFAAAAEGMFAVITGSASVEASRPVKVVAESIDIEGLLVSFLSELIVIHEVDNLVLTDFTVRFTGAFRLEALGYGEKFDPRRHGRGTQVKGVSYHMMEITDGRGSRPCQVQVLFDV